MTQQFVHRLELRRWADDLLIAEVRSEVPPYVPPLKTSFIYQGTHFHVSVIESTLEPDGWKIVVKLARV